MVVSRDQVRLGRHRAPPLTPPNPNSIIADPKNPTLYTNRAMARLKLRLWDSVMADCNTCLELKPDNMKAFYYLSQAQLELQIFDSALKNALEAHKLCVETHDKSLQQVTNSVLRCKKERWEDMEKRRRREGTELEAALVALLERERDETLRACGAAPSSATDTDGNIKNGDGNAAPAVGEDPEAIKKDVMAEYEEKIANLRITFEKARANDDKRREVPDWAIDDISFSIMVDPVIVRCCPSL